MMRYPLSSSRRTFLKAGATLTGSLALPGPAPLLAQLGRRPEPVPPIQDPRLKALVQRGLDAATAAGAEYADVRLTHTRFRNIGVEATGDEEMLGVGVRALIKGYWGFASSTLWNPEEIIRLGTEAAHQAQVNTIGKPRIMSLAPVPKIEDGHWTMPVKRDPFAIWPGEMMDFLRQLLVHAARIPYSAGTETNAGVGFWLQRKAFGATTGSYYTQDVYRGKGNFEHWLLQGQVTVDTLTPAGMGWELFEEGNLPDVLRQAADEYLADLALPVKPLDVGRYDIVCDARSMTHLLDGSIGAATELDRTLGYDANSGGTSYLTDPVAMLGTYAVGSPKLTVTANRTQAGGAATVRWDDEGVSATEFPLIRQGVVTNFQTMREGAAWLKTELPASQGQAVTGSQGCAAAPTAIDLPVTHCANLVMESEGGSGGFDDLCKTLQRGVAFKNLRVSMDFQQVNGLGIGVWAFEVKNGKRTARIPAGLLFRTPELWKSLETVGGAAHARRYGLEDMKGQPVQITYKSITAVPGLFKNMAIIDPKRKA